MGRVHFDKNVINTLIVYMKALIWTDILIGSELRIVIIIIFSFG